MVLANPLTILFNLSLSQAYFPKIWKIAAVITILRQGDECEITNLENLSSRRSFNHIFTDLRTLRLMSVLNILKCISIL